jgi:hypothetical protein
LRTSSAFFRAEPIASKMDRSGLAISHWEAADLVSRLALAPVQCLSHRRQPGLAPDGLA